MRVVISKLRFVVIRWLEAVRARSSLLPRALIGSLILFGWLQAAGAQLLDSSKEKTEEQQLATIEAGVESIPSDTAIRSRLEDIYSNLPDLADINVVVSDGVIVLKGNVDDSRASERAEQLAQRVAGAVIVVNNITRDRSIQTRIDAAIEAIQSGMKDSVGNTPLILLAMTVVGLAFLAAKLAGRAQWLYRRLSSNWFIRDLLRQILQMAIVFAGVVIALQLLDASALLGSMVGALGIFGLALGFATRDTVENYIASILLSVRQPFRRDDLVCIDSIEGKVLRLTARATVLVSLDGNHIRIPNSRVYKATIVNYTLNPLRRFEFKVGVDTDLDLNLPRELAVATLRSLPGVLESPGPVCLVEALGDSSVVRKLPAWIDQRETDFQKLRSEAQRVVKEAFDDAGVVMPEPLYNINLRRGEQQLQSSPPTIPPSAPADSSATDTSPDRTVDQQVRDQSISSEDEDLLSRDAPTE